uniref:sn-1-specific diacylglycerol lipase ABHD11 n=3 Tax=Timema TaxID=61471 RepID=A0A7R8ZAZ1_TIMDO|nr:unnamed protein product [Timema douglasi]
MTLKSSSRIVHLLSWDLFFIFESSKMLYCTCPKVWFIHHLVCSLENIISGSPCKVFRVTWSKKRIVKSRRRIWRSELNRKIIGMRMGSNRKRIERQRNRDTIASRKRTAHQAVMKLTINGRITILPPGVQHCRIPYVSLAALRICCLMDYEFNLIALPPYDEFNLITLPPYDELNLIALPPYDEFNLITLHPNDEFNLITLYPCDEFNLITLHPYDELILITLHPYDEFNLITLHPYDELILITLHPYDELILITLHTYDEFNLITLHPYDEFNLITLHPYDELILITLHPYDKLDLLTPPLSDKLVLLNSLHISSSIEPVKMAYTCYEATNDSGNDNPIIIMHGLLAVQPIARVTIQPPIMLLSVRKNVFQVIAVDARNHGDSPHTPELSYKHMASDVRLLINELQIRQASLIGHSMGGRVMMYFALTYPDIIDKLVVVDISPVRVSPGLTVMPEYFAAMKSVNLDINTSLSVVRKKANHQLSKYISDEGVRQFFLTNLVEGEKGHYKWRINLDSISNNFGQIANFPSFGNTFDKPTIFIGGANSDYIKPEDQPAIECLFTFSRFEYIDGASHWVHADKPHEFVLLVTNFLKE